MYMDLHIGYQLMIEKESVFNLHAKKCQNSIPLSNVSLAIKNYMFLSDEYNLQCWTVGAIFTFGRSRSRRIKKHMS